MMVMVLMVMMMVMVMMILVMMVMVMIVTTILTRLTHVSFHCSRWLQDPSSPATRALARALQLGCHATQACQR